MRKGINPQKNSEVTTTEYYHKVIVPVYVPHQEEYYKDAFKILKICLYFPPPLLFLSRDPLYLENRVWRKITLRTTGNAKFPLKGLNK